MLQQWERQKFSSASTYFFPNGLGIRSQPTNLRKNNLMQICSVISEWRVPGKQGCRALWLDVSERSGGESSSFVAGLPA